MKKLIIISATIFMLAACGNDSTEPKSDGYNNSDTSAGQRSDTSSYERMPNKTSDTSR